MYKKWLPNGGKVSRQIFRILQLDNAAIMLKEKSLFLIKKNYYQIKPLFIHLHNC